MLYNLIAIDPGGETGIACAMIPADDMPAHKRIQSAFRTSMGYARQIGGDPKAQALACFAVIQERMKMAGHGNQDTYDVRTVVACEDFQLRQKALRKSALLPVIIGHQIEYHLWIENLIPNEVEWRWQQPTDMAAIPDATLRMWKLWQPGKRNDDAMAALRHLIVLARRLEEQ